MACPGSLIAVMVPLVVAVSIRPAIAIAASPSLYGSRTPIFSISTGMRTFGHYVPEQMPRTPPTAWMLGAHASGWISRFGAVTAFASSSVGGAPATEIGGALMPLLGSFRGGGFINSLSILAAVEGVYYKTEPPRGWGNWDSSGFQFRYGLTIFWRFAADTLFFETRGLAVRYSDNWCLAPYLGLGMSWGSGR